MGVIKWAVLAAAGAVAWSLPASADELVYQRTETVRPGGVFDSPFNKLAFGQGYQIKIVLPAAPSSYSAEVAWYGNREEYFETGGYDLTGSNNTIHPFDVPLTLDGNVLTGLFVSPQDYVVYWPNGNIKTMFIGKTNFFDYRAQLDPSFAGAEVYVTLTAVPEPTTWALMIAGLGLVGGAIRRRRTMDLEYA